MTSSSTSESAAQPGPGRRAVIAAGAGAVALTIGPPGTGAAVAATSTGAETATASRPPRSGTGWRRYVKGPASGSALPGRVWASAGDFAKPEPLLHRGAASTVLRRPQPAAA